jgi:hypothetical protein
MVKISGYVPEKEQLESDPLGPKARLSETWSLVPVCRENWREGLGEHWGMGVAK